MKTSKKFKFSKGILYPYFGYPCFRIFLSIITVPIFFLLKDINPDNVLLIRRMMLILISFLIGVYSIELFPKFKPPIVLSLRQKIVVYITYLVTIVLFELYLF